MTTQHGLVRVFWPIDVLNSSKAGVIVGWRNDDLDTLVVTVLEGVEVRAPNGDIAARNELISPQTRSVANALQIGTLFRGSPHPVEEILKRCGQRELHVLGYLNPSTTPTTFDPHDLAVFSTRRGQPPQIYCAPNSDVTAQVITFERPDPSRMQYLSLAPISLTLGETSDRFGLTGPPFEGLDAEVEAEKRRKEKLVKKLKLHTVIERARSRKELALPHILNQINSSSELDQLMHKNIGLVGVRSKRALSVGERVIESATTLWDEFVILAQNVFQAYIWPVLSHMFILGLVAHRSAGEVLLQILEWRVMPDSAALKDISATAQQVDIRLQQFCYWPIQYITLRRRRNSWGSITNDNPEYIRFYNSLWLVANDVIIGIALGSYIIDNADFVAATLSRVVDAYFIEGLQRMISWLMGWPAGLKLNNELAKFLGDLFLWVIEYWAGCMQTLEPALPRIIQIIGFSSFAGASMPISLFSDLLSILTIHIYSFYIASARIYNWQLTIIVSLFHLFRGKKRNVLRNRIDSCDYDLDQLLLGTIFFTLLTFLLPTVGVFYATFAGARMGIILLKAALDTWLACLNHFPLFALMLRIKDSRRLPGRSYLSML